MQTDFPEVGFENDGTVARITLRHPPLNILDLEMIRELNRVLRDLRDDSALRAIVFRAEGRAFSAGVSVQDHLPQAVASTLGAFHDVFRHLRRLGCPTIAAVQGPALGGGCELACFADLVIASENASFGLPEIKLGVFPPVAVVHFPQRIGLARTLDLVLGGETIPAREAERIGLVDRVVAADALDGAVHETVGRLRDKSAIALRLARRAVFGATARDFGERLAEAERLYLEELMATADAPEGLCAFLEKRAPAWTHH